MSEMPKKNIETREAAEAIYMLFQTFEQDQSDANFDAWRYELEEAGYADLAAMVFFVSRDQ